MLQSYKNFLERGGGQGLSENCAKRLLCSMGDLFFSYANSSMAKGSFDHTSQPPLRQSIDFFFGGGGVWVRYTVY